MLKSKRVLTKNIWRNQITKIAMRGDISIPKRKRGGSIFLIGSRRGSVTLRRNCTIKLYGSGLTQLINALIRINQ